MLPMRKIDVSLYSPWSFGWHEYQTTAENEENFNHPPRSWRPPRSGCRQIGSCTMSFENHANDCCHLSCCSRSLKNESIFLGLSAQINPSPWTNNKGRCYSCTLLLGDQDSHAQGSSGEACRGSLEVGLDCCNCNHYRISDFDFVGSHSGVSNSVRVYRHLYCSTTRSWDFMIVRRGIVLGRSKGVFHSHFLADPTSPWVGHLGNHCRNSDHTMEDR